MRVGGVLVLFGVGRGLLFWAGWRHRCRRGVGVVVRDPGWFARPLGARCLVVLAWLVGVGGFEVVFAGFGVFVNLPAVVVDFVVAVVAYQHQVVYVGRSVL